MTITISRRLLLQQVSYLTLAGLLGSVMLPKATLAAGGTALGATGAWYDDPEKLRELQNQINLIQAQSLQKRGRNENEDEKRRTDVSLADQIETVLTLRERLTQWPVDAILKIEGQLTRRIIEAAEKAGAVAPSEIVDRAATVKQAELAFKWVGGTYAIASGVLGLRDYINRGDYIRGAVHLELTLVEWLVPFPYSVPMSIWHKEIVNTLTDQIDIMPRIRAEMRMRGYIYD